MADQSASPRFHALFVSALQAYERKTGVTLAQYPLAVQLQSCLSAGDATILLQSRAHAFSDCYATDKIMESIKTTVSNLALLSNAVTLTDAVGPVRQTGTRCWSRCFTSLTAFLKTLFPPAKAIQAGLGVLLDVCTVL
jgi:hypothetical protein